MEIKRKKPDKKSVREEDKNNTGAVYYYCPHCRESHDRVKKGEKPGEAVCPVCGEVYPVR